MIYFDENKKAYMQYIDNHICVISDEIWNVFCSLTLGVEWDIVNGQFVDLRQSAEYKAKEIEKAKAEKKAESDKKLNERRYGQTFTVVLHEQECVFDTGEKTQQDLTTAGIVTATGQVYPDWVTNNGVTIDLTAEDLQIIFSTFFPLVAPLYQKELYYIDLINNAQTVEEVKSIIINYEELV